MRCYCCDKLLTDKEVQYLPGTKKFDMCSICLDIAMETAYADGFSKPDDADGVAVLDPEDTQEQLFAFPSGFTDEEGLRDT